MNTETKKIYGEKDVKEFGYQILHNGGTIVRFSVVKEEFDTYEIEFTRD